MTRAAVIISGTGITERKGILDIALTRCEYLKKLSELQFDIYVFSGEYRFLSPKNLFSKTTYRERISRFGYDITLLKHIEFESSIPILQNILDWSYKRNKKRLADWEWQKDFAKYFKGYDLVIAHFNDAAILAREIHHKFGTPYSVTWHGSDIHTIPFDDGDARVKTITCIEHATQNFFVSQALLDISNKLTHHGNKSVLYNGIDLTRFKTFSDEKKNQLRQEFGADGKKVVTFAGRLHAIKNAQLLPDIFKEVRRLSNLPIIFWIIGDGPLQHLIEQKLSAYHLDCKLWGAQPNDKMPFFYNCTDILVAPSQNEGLGMVGIEAISCGANAIGSDAGGLKEALGENFCVPLGDDFKNRFALKVSDILDHPIPQHSPASQSWDDVAKQEEDIYQQIIASHTLVQNLTHS